MEQEEFTKHIINGVIENIIECVIKQETEQAKPKQEIKEQKQEIELKLSNISLLDSSLLIVTCPWCSSDIEIEQKQLNCCIFRHGIFKHNYQQIPPHASKQLCDHWELKKLIYGCGKPFKVIIDTGAYTAIKCDYI